MKPEDFTVESISNLRTNEIIALYLNGDLNYQVARRGLFTACARRDSEHVRICLFWKQGKIQNIINLGGFARKVLIFGIDLSRETNTKVSLRIRNKFSAILKVFRNISDLQVKYFRMPHLDTDLVTCTSLIRINVTYWACENCSFTFTDTDRFKFSNFFQINPRLQRVNINFVREQNCSQCHDMDILQNMKSLFEQYVLPQSRNIQSLTLYDEGNETSLTVV